MRTARQSTREAPNLAVGEVLWDLTPAGARLGGTTANYAILSARLGGSAALATCVGDDELGREAQQRLSSVIAAGGLGELSTAAVQVSPQLPTGTVGVVLDAEGRPRYEIHAPVAWDAIQLTDGLRELSGRASAMCFGTLAQRDAVSRATIRAVVEGAAQQCVRVCDLNLRMPFCSAEVLRWCLAHADVVKVSDEELPEVARLLGEPAVSGSVVAAESHATDDAEAQDRLTAAAVQAGQALLRLAPRCRLVALTLGPHGSVLVDGHGWDRHTGYPVQVVDTIGAGDAFTAGLVHAFMHGAGLQAINIVSNLCGSYVASQSGATPELPEELLARIAAALG